MLTPLLSEEDPVAGSEGTIDPLGLAASADELADQLVPNQRQQALSCELDIVHFDDNGCKRKRGRCIRKRT